MIDSIHGAPLKTRMLQGAGLAAFMTVFEAVARRDHSTLGERIEILLVASLGGAIGGVAYYATDAWRARRGVTKTFANVLSLLAYCFAALLAFWVVYELGAFH
jgi:NhaP-type Na+/H+ or K+/H+ antiporter